MKKVWMILLVALMITFCCEGAYAQAKPLPEWVGGTKSAVSAWFDTTTVTTTSFQFVNGFVYNAGTDSIYVAKEKDTTMAKWIVVPPGYRQPIFAQMKLLRVKARTTGTAYQYYFQ